MSSYFLRECVHLCQFECVFRTLPLVGSGSIAVLCIYICLSSFQSILPIMNEFAEVETCVEVSNQMVIELDLSGKCLLCWESVHIYFFYD